VKSYSKSKATIERDKAAKIRLAARNSRTDEQQLALLEARGAGLCNEAQRIRERLGATQNDGVEIKAEPRKRPARKRRAVPASLM
jgi:hypothetical protein